MEQNQNLGQVKILFGEDYEGQGESYLDLNIKFNKEEAINQKHLLETSTSNQCDVDWSIVFAISVLPENQEELLKSLEQLTTEQQDLDESDVYYEIYTRLIKPGWFIPKITKSQSDGKIYVSFMPSKGFDKEIIEPFMQSYNQGLGEIVSNTLTQLSLNLSTNKSTSQYIQEFDNQEMISAVLPDSVKLQAEINSNPEIFEKLFVALKKIQNGAIEAVAQLGGIALAFSNIDIDMRFESTKQLSEVVKQHVFMGQTFKSIWNGQEPVGQLEKDKLLRSFIKTIDTDVEVYITIPDFAAVKASGHAQNLSKIIEKVLY